MGHSGDTVISFFLVGAELDGPGCREIKRGRFSELMNKTNKHSMAFFAALHLHRVPPWTFCWLTPKLKEEGYMAT